MRKELASSADDLEVSPGSRLAAWAVDAGNRDRMSRTPFTRGCADASLPMKSGSNLLMRLSFEGR
jgi:hypothetical protein